MSHGMHQLATPTSLSTSFRDDDESQPGHKKARLSPDHNNKPYLQEKRDLLQSVQALENEGSPQKLQATHNYDYERSEDELSVWGYMISNEMESLSFLLSKESRCGKNKENCKEVTRRSNHNRDEGVILKDYNGDNLASSGYLIGEDDECDVVIHHSDVCARHCVIFKIHKQTGHDAKNAHYEVYVQDISGQGTYINGEILSQNNVAMLRDCTLLSLSPNGPSWTFKQTHASSGRSFDRRFNRGRTLGKGHFAEVFQITDVRTRQEFAAKKMNKQVGKNSASFLAEIGLLMSCTHPTITCIRDVFDTPEAVYLVLEYAAGGELFDRIVQKGKFSEDETRFLFRQIFSALAYLHSRSIVHRDIKPENILLTSQELEVRLADFGLARIIDHNAANSTLAGTPSYIPPEMLMPTKDPSGSLPYNNKVDSWSAGVVLYICLCGFPPFSSELAPPPMKTQIREGRFNFTRPYWDVISDGAIDLVQKLLTVDVAKRYSIQEAMQHPWMQGKDLHSENASQGSSKIVRGIKRQRTFLQDIGRTR